MAEALDDFWNTRTPPRWLRLRLQAAREAGVPFQDAWAGAVASFRGPDSEEWRALLAKQEDAWRRAFDGEPAPRREAACGEIGDRFEELADLTLADRVCEHCGEPISPDRDPRARFCSDAHRWAAARLSQSRTDRPGGPADVRAGVPDSGGAIQTAAA